jgi:hypothetical protein
LRAKERGGGGACRGMKRRRWRKCISRSRNGGGNGIEEGERSGESESVDLP